MRNLFMWWSYSTVQQCNGGDDGRMLRHFTQLWNDVGRYRRFWCENVRIVSLVFLFLLLDYQGSLSLSLTNFTLHSALQEKDASVKIKQVTAAPYRKLLHWMTTKDETTGEIRMHSLEMAKKCDTEGRYEWVSPRNFVNWVGKVSRNFLLCCCYNCNLIHFDIYTLALYHIGNQ